MPVDWLEKRYFKTCIAHWGRYTGAPSGATDTDADERLCEDGPLSTCHAEPLGLVRGLLVNRGAVGVAALEWKMVSRIFRALL
jgi:hypothetical protein